MECLFRDRLRLFLGDGESVKFWVEGRVLLMDRFSSLFVLSVQRDESVCGVWNGISESWVMQWVREFSTNEFLKFVNLWQCILNYKVNVQVADTWCW